MTSITGTVVAETRFRPYGVRRATTGTLAGRNKGDAGARGDRDEPDARARP